MASFGLDTATARARRVARAPREDGNDVRGRTLRTDQVSHQAHRTVDMVEEGLVSGAEIVETLRAVRGGDEPVLWALAVAGEADIAIKTIPRKASALLLSEEPLLSRGDELDEMGLADVTEEVSWLHEVITRVDVSVVFESHSVATGFCEYADCSW